MRRAFLYYRRNAPPVSNGAGVLLRILRILGKLTPHKAAWGAGLSMGFVELHPPNCGVTPPKSDKKTADFFTAVSGSFLLGSLALAFLKVCIIGAGGINTHIKGYEILIIYHKAAIIGFVAVSLFIGVIC